MPTESGSLTAFDLQQRGGFARAKKLTPEERTRIAKLAAQARWAKKATAPDPTDPQGPQPGEQPPKTGILSTPRIPCRTATPPKNLPGLAAAQIRLFEAA